MANERDRHGAGARMLRRQGVDRHAFVGGRHRRCRRRETTCHRPQHRHDPLQGRPRYKPAWLCQTLRTRRKPRRQIVNCPTAPKGGPLSNRQTLSIYAPFAIELALPFRPYSMIQKSEYRFPDMIVLHVKSWSMTAPKGLSQEHAKSGLDRANGSHGHERMMRFKMEAFNGYRYR